MIKITQNRCFWPLKASKLKFFRGTAPTTLRSLQHLDYQMHLLLLGVMRLSIGRSQSISVCLLRYIKILDGKFCVSQNLAKKNREEIRYPENWGWGRNKGFWGFRHNVGYPIWGPIWGTLWGTYIFF